MCPSPNLALIGRDPCPSTRPPRTRGPWVASRSQELFPALLSSSCLTEVTPTTTWPNRFNTYPTARPLCHRPAQPRHPDWGNFLLFGTFGLALDGILPATIAVSEMARKGINDTSALRRGMDATYLVRAPFLFAPLIYAVPPVSTEQYQVTYDSRTTKR